MPQNEQINARSKELNKNELDAATLYFGEVMHARLKPVQHRFNYRVFSLLIDIDRLHEANALSAIFSVNRGNLVSFKEADHGPRDGSSLREFINKLLVNGHREAPEKVYLWCNPRILGYTFNPLSIYFCFDRNGELSDLVYQVHNTFGQSHCYVAPVDQDDSTSGYTRQKADKNFYVSPFLDMDLEYNFSIKPPDDTLRIKILEKDADGPILSATFKGDREPLSTRKLLLGITRTLGLTWKIIGGIHFEALWLWIKGLKVRPRPAEPKLPSYIGTKSK